MRMQVQSLASLSGLKIWHCCELWCRSQMWLGSCIAVAVAVASSYTSDSTPSLGTSMCHRCGPKKQKRKTKKTQEMIPKKVSCPVSHTNQELWPHWAGSGDLARACQAEGTVA